MSTSKQMKYIDSAGKETIVDIAVNAVNVENNTFSQAAARTNIASGETLPGIFAKLAKWFTDLKAVAWSGKYTDLTDRPALGAAAAYAVANDCGTTAANFVLDARQGQVLQANINQVNYNLSASINNVSGSLGGNRFGMTADGQPGYKKAGADTVYPFNSTRLYKLSGTSGDLKNILPNEFNKITLSNFLITYSTITATYSGTAGLVSVQTSPSVSISYVPTSGIWTLNNTAGAALLPGTTASWLRCNATFIVYLYIGQLN